MNELREVLEENPVIAAVKDDDGLAECCGIEEVKAVFVLYGDACTVVDIVRKIKIAGKKAYVHVDLIAGLSAREAAVRFIAEYTEADGIISTKPALIAEAAKCGLQSILRIFLLDSMAIRNLEREVRTARPDAVEVLPGLMPKIIRKIAGSTRLPIIAGGLISDREDIVNALDAGAISVSSTNREVWKL
ncbi:MAG: glycerol-3-phosphate responsive antiterminator [Eubacterium sp.]|nr:glycerol-3-phosphate responsive antiterminator [Eubacterium sp.]